MKNLKGILSTVRSYLARLEAIEERCQRMQEALGRIENRQLDRVSPAELRAAEFQAFSQWGEDGILAASVAALCPISKKVFVEFGVENYTEANTRFLLVNDNWTGLVIDGSRQNIDYIRRNDISWRLQLESRTSFYYEGKHQRPDSS